MRETDSSQCHSLYSSFAFSSFSPSYVPLFATNINCKALRLASLHPFAETFAATVEIFHHPRDPFWCEAQTSMRCQQTCVAIHPSFMCKKCRVIFVAGAAFCLLFWFSAPPSPLLIITRNCSVPFPVLLLKLYII